MVLWLLAQLGAVALSAFRVPLAARFPQPAEFQAVRVMLTVQFTMSAMLAPLLLRTWGTAIVTAASGFVMLELAALLAGWPFEGACVPATYLTLWLLVLSSWLIWLTSVRWRMIAAASATVYVLGGAFLWYLAQEFGGLSPASKSITLGALVPVLLDPSGPPFIAWMLLGGLTLAGLLTGFLRAPVSGILRP